MGPNESADILGSWRNHCCIAGTMLITEPGFGLPAMRLLPNDTMVAELLAWTAVPLLKMLQFDRRTVASA